jgi:hypothetical protein
LLRRSQGQCRIAASHSIPVPEIAMHPAFRLVTGVLFLAGCALLSGCATGPTIRSQTNPGADPASHETFAFFSPLATDRAGYESVLTARLKDATRRNLEAKGYVYAESDPDLLVNFFANIEDRQEIRTYPAAPAMGAGYYGYRTGYYGGWGGYHGGYRGTEIETVNYKAGTLTIDLVDPAEKVLVWQGQAEGRVSSKARQNPGPAIDAVVAEIIELLPARAAQ